MSETTAGSSPSGCEAVPKVNTALGAAPVEPEAVLVGLAVPGPGPGAPVQAASGSIRSTAPKPAAARRSARAPLPRAGLASLGCAARLDTVLLGTRVSPRG